MMTTTDTSKPKGQNKNGKIQRHM